MFFPPPLSLLWGSSDQQIYHLPNRETGKQTQTTTSKNHHSSKIQLNIQDLVY